MCSMKAMKVSHIERKNQKALERDLFADYVGSYGNQRLSQRIMQGRKIKPCGRGGWELGKLIAKSYNHSSFENFDELMNDAEFVLEMAKITPNPVMCESYIYEFVNKYLTRDLKFRVQFLKNVYLNSNVYKKDDIEWVVNNYGLEKENALILNDPSFRAEFAKRIIDIEDAEFLEYHCSGEKKELHEYKVKRNDMKVLHENMKNGLNEILKGFAKQEMEEKIETAYEKDEQRIDVEDRGDYYSYLCKQTVKYGD